jgi:vacuolar-type H+-ATPase subunit H
MNTALDAVLEAEQNAAQTIQAAKDEAAETVAAARTEQRTTLAAEEKRLQEAAETALAIHQKQIDAEVDQIRQETDANVSHVEAAFSKQKDALIELVRTSLQT